MANFDRCGPMVMWARGPLTFMVSVSVMGAPRAATVALGPLWVGRKGPRRGPGAYTLGLGNGACQAYFEAGLGAGY